MKKNHLLHFFILSLAISIQISIPGCEDKKDDNSISVDINDPTNDYQVVVQIYGMGSMSCAAGGVKLNGDDVDDAIVKINNKELTHSDSSDFTISSISPFNMLLKYFYEGNELTFTSGTKYDLQISHNGNSIASGIAYMPKTPEITNIESPYAHIINTPLVIEWDEDNYTSLFQVNCSANLEDEEGNEIEKEFEEVFSSSITTCTIPDTFFNSPGEYFISISAIYGVTEESITVNPDTTMGYNILGPSGSFLALTVFPSNPFGDGFIINVSESASIVNSKKKSKFSYKNHLLKIFNRNNFRFNYND